MIILTIQFEKKIVYWKNTKWRRYSCCSHFSRKNSRKKSRLHEASPLNVISCITSIRAKTVRTNKMFLQATFESCRKYLVN